MDAAKRWQEAIAKHGTRAEEEAEVEEEEVPEVIPVAGQPHPTEKCSICGQDYIWERDFHPRGGGLLVPSHRCLASGNAVFGIRKIIRRLPGA